MEKGVNKCLICKESIPAGNEMQCAGCGAWYHSTCCDKDSNAATSNWQCEFCYRSEHHDESHEDNLGHEANVGEPNLNLEQQLTGNSEREKFAMRTESSKTQPQPVASNSKAHATEKIGGASISRKKELRLQQLEEEMRIKEEFLRRKYQILRASDSEDETDSIYKTILPRSHIRQQVSSESAASHNFKRAANVQVISTDKNEQAVYSQQTINFPSPASQSTAVQINPNTHSCNEAGNLTTMQLAARHAVTKDLPLFGGDPQDWPLFISAFEQSTRVAGYSNDENLIRLQKCLKGKAREAVRSCLLLPEMVPDVIRTLKMYFGRPEHILKTLIDRVRKLPPPRGKLEPLIEFAFAVKNICATMRAGQLNEYLNNPTLLHEFVEKLSPETMLNWALYSKEISSPNLNDFSEWLYNIAEAACRVTTPIFSTVDENKPRHRNANLNAHSSAAEDMTKSLNDNLQCKMCGHEHKIAECQQFKELSLNERWNVVKENKLCRQCLGKHRRRCYSSKLCGINGCAFKHNMLLHNKSDSPAAVSTTLNSHRSFDADYSYSRILPVTLYGSTKSIKTYAFMDDGSTLTLIEESLANEMCEIGEKEPLCIRWTGDLSRYDEHSRRINLEISSQIPNSKVFPLRNVHTVKNLKMSPESMEADKVKDKYPYLKDIPLQSYKDAVPRIIIGINNPNLTVALKVLEGSWHQPIASKTRLGWTLFGGGTSTMSEKSLYIHKCSCNNDKYIHDLVKNYLTDEGMGTASTQKIPMSLEDQLAMKILDDTCELNDNRYTVGLLWKKDGQDLPDSLPTATRRMHCLKRNMARDPQLAKNIEQQINNLIVKGYVTQLPADATEQKGGHIWYLPIFIVCNPHKPSKVRLVWDAAAKTSGLSLNDFLLKGPNLLKPLINILFNFRMGSIAICGDIAEMYHRIAVREQDAVAQRFLSWDKKHNSIEVYQLNVLTFGASCSPCIAHYIRDRNASRFEKDDPKAVEAITQHHYVDDFIDSGQTVEEILALAKSVRHIHACGGFIMRNWVSNSKLVLEALDEKRQLENKTFECNEIVTQYEKILGMHWDPEQDVFKYVLKFVRLRRNVFNKDVVPTKREVLQVLMSVFDPLGFVSCITSYLKIILQDIWRSGIDWDQQLTEDLNEKWQRWLSYLPMVTTVCIPRCYSVAIYQNDCEIQLHTFVDASDKAYAAVSYFRIVSSSGVEITIVSAKSKVAPLRPVSIPRLELQAALIGARLTNTISSGHKINIKQRFIWTDSKTVLKWLQNNPRQYQQFVMFRVAEIHEVTQLSEWRWIPSKLNVADIATKTQPCLDKYDQWFLGPEFLKNSESEWPAAPELENIQITELRPKFLHIRKIDVITLNFEYFSSWTRLCRAVANWFVYIEKLNAKSKKKTNVITLSAQHFRLAKSTIYKVVQVISFADEWTALKFEKPIPKENVLGKLNLYLDENDVICVKNRAGYFSHNYKPQRDFIVLPADHQVTKLIVSHYHQAFHHINHETTINEIRQIYFIPKLRSIFKTIRAQCQMCKIHNAMPHAPRIAPLPKARLGAFLRPFTYVGIDYFGPLLVNENRKSCKRWGVLITCLTIRAIHVEIAHNLNTDSCLMCLRNFIARRGTPQEIYSDNGTNFRGADNFLKAELKNINNSILERELAHKEIIWKFNPPAAPHMGGAWERLVRSIKTVLYKISPSQRFTDESLRTALLEVEMVVNSRPLTFVSLDSEDQEAITPNHFLLGSSNGSKPFCNPENINYRMNLRQSETFSNMFWRRWVIEMLPTFTRKERWFQKVKSIAVGDIVLIVDENMQRNTWLKGKVVDTVMAKDGQVRRAKVKTLNGIIERPAVKLAVLNVDKDEEKLT